VWAPFKGAKKLSHKGAKNTKRHKDGKMTESEDEFFKGLNSRTYTTDEVAKNQVYFRIILNNKFINDGWDYGKPRRKYAPYKGKTHNMHYRS
jgi:hypothetical protein